MKPENLTPETLAGFSKSELINVIMALVGQVAQLTEQNAQLRKENAQLRKDNAVLVQRVSEPGRRLGLNGRSSGRPPSSDGLAKPASDRKRRPKSLRGKSDRKSGGQPGHPGRTLKQVENPDGTTNHFPTQCQSCQAALSPEDAMGSAARQVFGLEPPPPLSVTEHRAHTCECRHCGAETRVDFPEDVTAPTQHDDQIGVLAAYLQTRHCIPEERLAQVFADILGARITSATPGRLIDKKARRMSRSADAVKNLLPGSQTAVKHLDETGFGIVGGTRWLHMLCSTSLSHPRLGACRGEVPPTLAGTAVHDCWPANFKVGNAVHGLCNAHILGEPQSLIEYGKEAWASDMKTVPRDALKLTHVARSQGQSAVNPDAVREIRRRFDACCEQAITFHENEPPLVRPTGHRKRGRPKRRTGHDPALRLQAHRTAVPLFLEDLNVPFSNNEAERGPRMTKVRQKVSGCFRTEDGARNFCTLRTVIETARKQGWDILQTLKTSPDHLILNLRPS